MRYWKRTDSDCETIAVESCSHSLKITGATEITEMEFNQFIDNLPVEEE